MFRMVRYRMKLKVSFTNSALISYQISKQYFRFDACRWLSSSAGAVLSDY